jgi:hypothetical protein
LFSKKHSSSSTYESVDIQVDNELSAEAKPTQSELNATIVIDNKKISNHLGAQMGTHPSSGITKRNKNRVNKNSSSKTQFLSTNDNKEYSTVSMEDSSSSWSEFKNIKRDNYLEPSLQFKRNTKNTVFGVSFNSIMQKTGQPLPQKILEAMKVIRKVAQYEVGIFRKNGNKLRINKLKEAIDSGQNIDFESEDMTYFDVADLIKLYFRELPECLITNKISDVLISIYSSKFYLLIYFFSIKLNIKNILIL